MIPRVLIAPDKLKGSLTAAEAARAIARGVERAWPEARVRILPIADGGDGTVAALVAAGRAVGVDGKVEGWPVTFAVSASEPRIVVAEVAQVGGLGGRRPTPAEARAASSWPAGRLASAALDLAPDRLVVGIGGTASTDGGAGALAALGARILDPDGRSVGRAGLAGVARAATIDLASVDPRVASLVVAADVGCPLTGATGAVRMFGRQKGLDATDLAWAEEALARFGDLLQQAGGVDVAHLPGGGAGGGLAAGLAAAARTLPALGAGIVLDLVGADDALRDTDVVITAEGSLDAQSLLGKAPIVIARRAAALGVPCLAVAGAVTLTAAALHAEGIVAAAALVDLEPDPAKAMDDASRLLAEATAALLGDRR